MDPKKKVNPKQRQLIASLRRQAEHLKSEWMRLEGDRIQLAVRHTDLLSHWNTVSCTYAGALRQKNETILQMLREAGIGEPSPGALNSGNEKDLREVVLPTSDKAEQTELW